MPVATARQAAARGDSVEAVPSDESRTLAMVRTLLDRAHFATPGQLPDVVLEAVRELGWTAALYVVDYDQRVLVPAPVKGTAVRAPQAIDATLAGRCFRSVQPVPSTAGEPTLWLPIVDGADRLGVLEVTLPSGSDLDDVTLRERCRLVGHLTGHLMAAKRPYGDGLEQVMRLRPRTVASDLLHQVLPPLTFACEGLVISGLLQPVYDVAADAFDYSVLDETAHLAVLDATGHDLNGTVLAAVALSAYRNSRRGGHGIYDSARAIDEHIAVQGRGERFATGVLGELDLPSGRLRYLNAGHPPPLLLREAKVVKQLTEGHRILLGLGQGEGSLGEEWLEPRDRVVFYTDGITDARGEDGSFFGLDRLIDHLERSAGAGQPAPETLRRISHDVVDYQGSVLQDDATLLIVEWASGGEQTMTSTWDESVRIGGLSPTHGPDEDVPRR